MNVTRVGIQNAKYMVSQNDSEPIKKFETVRSPMYAYQKWVTENRRTEYK